MDVLFVWIMSTIGLAWLLLFDLRKTFKKCNCCKFCRQSKYRQYFKQICLQKRYHIAYNRPALIKKLEGSNYQHKFFTGYRSLFQFNRAFVLVWKKLRNDNCLFEVELLQHFLQLRKLSRAVCYAGLGLYNQLDFCQICAFWLNISLCWGCYDYKRSCLS